MDRAVDAAASEQTGVRSVDDRGHVLASDVSNHNQHTSLEKRF